jgi:8-hydroxy-5-deazaflavin:NADPH oxidoreductase
MADVTLLQKSDANLLDQFEFDVVDAGPLVEGTDFPKDTPAYCVPLDSKK